MWLLWAMRVGALLTPIVPARAGYWICRVIGLVLYLLKLRTSRAVLDNLRHVAPQRSWLWRQRQAARVFITATMNYYDLVRLRSVDRDRLTELIEVHGWPHLEAALARGKGVIVLSAHLGNFSVVAQYPATLGLQAAVIAEQVQPPELFRYLARLRSAMGITVLPPGAGSVLPILRLLRKNGILLVAGDRDVTGHARIVRFFDAPASLPVGPVVLALRTGATLLPAYTVRRSTRKSVVFVEAPLELVRTGDEERDLDENMKLVARALERMIRVDPGQWSVLQRVWDRPLAEVVSQGEAIGQIPPELAQYPVEEATRG
uniref:Lipid A biosynthesis acyltransferase n=1 Tax=Thermorudis peleae TaxID=1382356 RepID=A0A831TJA6_9BACT